jgi:NAD-dependent protein deacetylase/lipoamidase
MTMDIVLSDRFLSILKSARHVVVSTGAGVSAESGVPTFRGADGLWKKFRPEELATFEAFQANPKIVWEWYQYRRDIIHSIRPNPGHRAIAEMPGLFEKFDLITQNVDGLHRAAGSEDVIELHGNIMRNKCVDCGGMTDDLEFTQFPPLCRCGGRLRPDVVWFGEMLPAKALERAERASLSCDIFFSVGTSGVVQPAAGLPYLARRHGAYIVEINPEVTDLTYTTDEHFCGRSGEILPALLEKMKVLRG